MIKKSLVPLLICALTAVAVLLMLPKYSYNDPDTFWHIELGRYMIDHATVLHHAIHTYAGDHLPYIPHEFGFQLMIAPLFEAFGWPGIYLLTASSILLLMTGLYKLALVSRKEEGLGQPPALFLAIFLLIAVSVYYYYFTSRPQMVSAGIIVWFFAILRLYRLSNSRRDAAILIVLSFLLANIHAGVWPVIAVFAGMAVIEAIAEKRLSGKRIAVFAAVFAVGLLNVGGWKSILFILTVTHRNFNLLINEWNPIRFSSLEDLPRLLALLFFAAILPFSLHKRLFRYLVMLGVLYLGVSNYKQNLFLWLFLPYFAATAVERIPMFNVVKCRIRQRHLIAGLAIGLLLQTAIVFRYPTEVDASSYPVEEMSYILDQAPAGTRPKVMAPYGASGYVMFRGGDVLCDGRQDPFITTASVGAYGWTAFERSMYGFSERLPEIVRSDHPDYVIAKNGVSEILYADWVKRYGAPRFKGKFGSVFLIPPQ